VLANSSYFLGLALGWLPLRPLLLIIGLDTLAGAFTWLLLATVVAGSARLAVFVYRLTAASSRACIALPILGIALPVLYWLLATRIWTALWPMPDSVIKFAFFAFAVISIGFLHQSALFVVHGRTGIEQEIRQNGHRFALGYLLMVAQAIGLLWIAVATM
jgi:hypothetical protein